MRSGSSRRMATFSPLMDGAMVRRFNQRQYDLFLSHAHADRAFVDELYAWLTGQAGFKVFYNTSRARPGARISSMLQEELENCRGVILVVSEVSVDSEWVRDEYNIAKDESNAGSDFRIVPVRLAKAPGKKLIKGRAFMVLFSTDAPPPANEVPGQVTPMSLVRKLFNLVFKARWDRAFTAIQ